MRRVSCEGALSFPFPYVAWRLLLGMPLGRTSRVRLPALVCFPIASVIGGAIFASVTLLDCTAAFDRVYGMGFLILGYPCTLTRSSVQPCDRSVGGCFAPGYAAATLEESTSTAIPLLVGRRTLPLCIARLTEGSHGRPTVKRDQDCQSTVEPRWGSVDRLGLRRET